MNGIFISWNQLLRPLTLSRARSLPFMVPRGVRGCIAGRNYNDFATGYTPFQVLHGGMLATDATSVYTISLYILRLRELLRRSNYLTVMPADNYRSCKG